MFSTCFMKKSIYLEMFLDWLKENTYHIDKIQSFTQEVTKSIGIVHVEGIVQIMYKFHLSVGTFFFTTNDCTSHSIRNHPDFTFFPVFPYPMGNVEEYALEKTNIFGLNQQKSNEKKKERSNGFLFMFTQKTTEVRFTLISNAIQALQQKV